MVEKVIPLRGAHNGLHRGEAVDSKHGVPGSGVEGPVVEPHPAPAPLGIALVRHGLGNERAPRHAPVQHRVLEQGVERLPQGAVPLVVVLDHRVVQRAYSAEVPGGLVEAQEGGERLPGSRLPGGHAVGGGEGGHVAVANDFAPALELLAGGRLQPEVFGAARRHRRRLRHRQLAPESRLRHRARQRRPAGIRRVRLPRQFADLVY
mmetsp:Transcript_38573/g.73878  ORF Transcript_38573/g.73878 Transcript_38573/m.73878 type:complete len:206 (+) Transcript_38573:574-1191(+)